jgi:DNA invertase Pin-like site-specific DNA recombinase
VSSASPFACYLRVSTKGQSLEPQRQQIKRWLALQGIHQPPREYTDTVSGADPRKPALKRLIEQCAKGGIKTVVVVAFDRIGRSTFQVLDTVGKLNAAGVEFVSLREQIDTRGPTGQLVLTVMAAIAQFEREMISERTKAGLKAAKAKGTHVGRPRLRWSDSSDETLKWMIEDGMTVTAIAKSQSIVLTYEVKDRDNGGMKTVHAHPSARSISRRMQKLGLATNPG